MKIDKDTKLFGSFSSKPGNNGCEYFNKRFIEENINAIYKSFFSENIEDSIRSAKILNFSGFAVSAPFKNECIKFIDEIDKDANLIQSVNTVVNHKGVLTGYNTDWIGVKNYLNRFRFKKILIIGNGNFSRSVQFACKNINLDFEIIERKNLDQLSDLSGSVVFNATPDNFNFVDKKNFLIDGRPFTFTGKEIFRFQAEEQYSIYRRTLKDD